MPLPRAPYLHWAKLRPTPTYDLAASSVAACSIGDLPGASDVLDLSGRNDDGFLPLVEAIARAHDMPVSGVATAQGASGANFLACAALIAPGDDVLVERPAYDPLLGAPQLLSGRVVRFQRHADRGFTLEPEEIAASITSRTRLIIFTNPHNPSGAVADESVLEEIGRLARRNGAVVLVDEVYLDATPGHRPPSAARLGPEFVSTSSLTKSYGLAGLRCGWTLASATITEEIRRARDLVDGTGALPTERLALVAFNHLDELRIRARAIIEPNRRRTLEFLRSRKELTAVEARGGTVAFPRLRDVASSDPLAEWLLEREGTAIVPGRFFEEPAHFRVGFGVRPAVLEGGLLALGRALDEGWFHPR